jgi:speckle-type POZ protein
MYTDTALNIGKMSKALLAAADKYALERLKVTCEDALCFNLTTDNVSDLLILADLHSAQQLKAQCLNFIASRAADVIASDGWQSVMEFNPQLLAEAFRTLAIQSTSSG